MCHMFSITAEEKTAEDPVSELPVCPGHSILKKRKLCIDKRDCDTCYEINCDIEYYCRKRLNFNMFGICCPRP